ncbi:hypothetical protein ON010_g6669 [Phytophthora cinnamomi]|nr:hypothetical protein ON010_g6669 [Phytophthora cinnamomi]
MTLLTQTCTHSPTWPRVSQRFAVETPASRNLEHALAGSRPSLLNLPQSSMSLSFEPQQADEQFLSEVLALLDVEAAEARHHSQAEEGPEGHDPACAEQGQDRAPPPRDQGPRGGASEFAELEAREPKAGMAPSRLHVEAHRDQAELRARARRAPQPGAQEDARPAVRID